jgi:pyrimidine and pyridine-specific 5'-nucleotidase
MDPHSTNEKVIRFGQQTNLCIGLLLMGDHFVAVTVDGVIRSLSISNREMLGSFKINELESGIGEEGRKGSHQIGGVSGGGTILSVEGSGRYMTVSRGDSAFRTSTIPTDLATLLIMVCKCFTRETILRLAWSGEEIVDQSQSVDSGTATNKSSSQSHLTLSPKRAGSAATPVNTLQRTRTVSRPAALTPTLVSKSQRAAAPFTPTPIRRDIAAGQAGLLSDVVRGSSSSSAKSSLTSTPVSSFRTSCPSDSSHTPHGSSPVSTNVLALSLSLRQPPRVIGTIQTRGVDRATTDCSGRFAVSTRSAAHGPGVQLYVLNKPNGGAQGTVLRPLTGVWTEKADELGLRLPGKKPKCMAMDRGRVVVGLILSFTLGPHDSD